jgi:tetratricopeptide (TPR) repeat protein
MKRRIAAARGRALGVWLTGPKKAIPGAGRTFAVRLRSALHGASEHGAVSEAEAVRIAREATADCVLVRARYLIAVGRIAAGLELRRNAWRHGRSRSEMIALTFKAAAEDDEFQSLVKRGDTARDERRWDHASGLYERALNLHPLHFGYRVQHAHMMKEQERYEAAEIDYRDALALGAPIGDVLQHLEFVCQRQHYYSALPPVTAAHVQHPLDERPSKIDIQALAYAMWQEEQVSEQDMLRILRSCATSAAAATLMISDPRFRRTNSPLLQMLSA